MKHKAYEYVQRIPSHYVGENCIQTMIPHLKDSITILNSSGMQYHYKPNSHLFVNNYISDERKEQFPYSQIPSHKTRVRFKKIECINQLCDFDRVYVKISDGMVVEYFVIKDGEEALMAIKYIFPCQRTEIMNRVQINELIKTANLGMYSFSGTKWEEFTLISDEEVLKWYKECLFNKIVQSSYTDKILDEFIYNSMEKLTPYDITLQPILMDNLILVSSNNNEIDSIKSLVIKFNGPDKYIVDIYDFPITIYNLEQMKHLEQTSFRTTSEPKISSFLNPQIAKNEIKKAKQLVIKRKKY